MTLRTAVWRAIKHIVEGTRGQVVNLRPSRIRRVAAKIGVAVDRGFERAMALILKYAFRECRVACYKRRRGGRRPICYVFNRRCVEEVLRGVGL